MMFNPKGRYQNTVVICLVFSICNLVKSSSIDPTKQNLCFEFICGTAKNPLCASDGVTYENGCKYSQAQCKNPSLVIMHLGACQVSQASNDTSPEIENNGQSTTIVTTENTTTPTAENITSSTTVVVEDTTTITPCMRKICPIDEEPLCASNGKTFRNNCEFKKAQCYNPRLEIVNKGPCDPNTSPILIATCEWGCENVRRPICATNGVTYPNICSFEKAKCKNKDLKIFKFGPC